ncbi:MAG TPA: DEAD/DEAH box helicase [Planctomycetaceae bacterium]|nr:DEAD/DEAH box helicase [Planctomycetaceae bacterium]
MNAVPSAAPLEILQKVFGHEEFRGRQREIIERTLSEQHFLVIMPTGSGKSLCYQIPSLVLANRGSDDREFASRRTLTLVLSPLIALMIDQVDALVGKVVGWVSAA